MEHMLLYNKTLSKHVTALFCLYLGNVENLVNHFRNAPVRGQCSHNYQLLYLIFVCLWAIFYQSTTYGINGDANENPNHGVGE